MNIIIFICVICVCLNRHVICYPTDSDKLATDKTNIDCIPPKESYTILEYNKLEIVNNLNKYPLKELVLKRGIMPEENQIFNQFMYCVWRKNMYLDSNNDLNYDLLENLMSAAIINVVGESGPAINLSILHASRILNEAINIKGSSPGNRIVKIQNFIVDKLRPFAEI